MISVYGVLLQQSYDATIAHLRQQESCQDICIPLHMMMTSTLYKLVIFLIYKFISIHLFLEKEGEGG